MCEETTVLVQRCGTGNRQAGFNLIELMVGLVIGLFAVVMMMQMFQAWDERRRTAASGNDATLSGVSAFYDLQRRVRQAGYGFTSLSLLNCQLTLPKDRNPLKSLPEAIIPLVPVTINPAASLVPLGDPNTDTLLVVSGNANSQTEGSVIQTNDGTNYVLQMSSGFADGDYVFASPVTCESATLTKVSGAPPSPTKVKTVAAPINASMLVNMGSQPSILAYAVRSGQLTVCDYMTDNCSASTTAPAWVAVAGNIVSLRVQYGRDTSSTKDGVLDLFDQTALGSGTGAAVCDDITRIGSVRIALVARSAQYETSSDKNKDAGRRTCRVVTRDVDRDGDGVGDGDGDGDVDAPKWDGSNAALIDLTKFPDGSTSTDWRCYRYRVFQSIVPLRNIDWLGNAGC